MVRRYFFSLCAIVSLLALTLIPFQPTADTYLMLAAVAALITLTSPSPAPVRAFWWRIVARTRDPVPSTT